MYKHHIKRYLDLIISSVVLIALLPIFLIILCVLGIANQGSPFFVQPRPGKNGRIFYIIKFKTMNDKRDKNGHLLSDAERLTRMGNFIRKTSLDEIPQLINVLKGDMSLIGPRPLLVEYLPLYSTEQMRRHEVKPGITGWAQVNGRNAISWEEKFHFDVWYVDHLSFWLDLNILFKTIQKIIKRDGINATGHATTERFTGTITDDQ